MSVTQLVAAPAPVALALAVLAVTDPPAWAAGHDDACGSGYPATGPARTGPDISTLSCGNGAHRGATAGTSCDAAPGRT